MDPARGAHLANLLLRSSDAAGATMAADLARDGHPGASPHQHRVMEAIDGGAGDASSLGRVLGVSRQAAAKAILSLEQLGYVERRRDPDDARRKPLTVTARGRERTRLGAAAYERMFRRLEVDAGADAMRAFEQVLTRIAAAG